MVNLKAVDYADATQPQPGVDLRWPASSVWRPGEPAVRPPRPEAIAGASPRRCHPRTWSEDPALRSRRRVELAAPRCQHVESRASHPVDPRDKPEDDG